MMKITKNKKVLNYLPISEKVYAVLELEFEDGKLGLLLEEVRYLAVVEDKSDVNFALTYLAPVIFVDGGYEVVEDDYYRGMARNKQEALGYYATGRELQVQILNK